MALSLVLGSSAFQGPVMAPAQRASAVTMRAEGEIGVTPPLGVYDPLNLLATPGAPSPQRSGQGWPAGPTPGRTAAGRRTDARCGALSRAGAGSGGNARTQPVPTHCTRWHAASAPRRRREGPAPAVGSAWWARGAARGGSRFRRVEAGCAHATTPSASPRRPRPVRVSSSLTRSRPSLAAPAVVYPRRSYDRYVELEIKHGRIAMLACLGVITTEAGAPSPTAASALRRPPPPPPPPPAARDACAVASPSVGRHARLAARAWCVDLARWIHRWTHHAPRALGRRHPLPRLPVQVARPQVRGHPGRRPDLVRGRARHRLAADRRLHRLPGARGERPPSLVAHPSSPRSCPGPQAAPPPFSTPPPLAARDPLLARQPQYGATPPGNAPGDVGGPTWIRYDDPTVKTFKLNAERNNGRAAMMGITGMMIHNALGVDSLFPIVQ